MFITFKIVTKIKNNMCFKSDKKRFKYKVEINN